MRVEKLTLGNATQLNASKTYHKKQVLPSFKANPADAKKIVKSGGLKKFASSDIIEKIKENAAKLVEAVKRRQEIVDEFGELVVKASKS